MHGAFWDDFILAHHSLHQVGGLNSLQAVIVYKALLHFMLGFSKVPCLD